MTQPRLERREAWRDRRGLEWPTAERAASCDMHAAVKALVRGPRGERDGEARSDDAFALRLHCELIARWALRNREALVEALDEEAGMARVTRVETWRDEAGRGWPTRGEAVESNLRRELDLIRDAHLGRSSDPAGVFDWVVRHRVAVLAALRTAEADELTP